MMCVGFSVSFNLLASPFCHLPDFSDIKQTGFFSSPTIFAVNLRAIQVSSYFLVLGLVVDLCSLRPSLSCMSLGHYVCTIYTDIITETVRVNLN